MKCVTTFCCFLLLMADLLPAQGDRYVVSLENPSVTSAFLRAAWFFNESSGYIAGSAGSVFFTDNSGETWRECPTPKRCLISSLYFHDVQKGWAAGMAGTESYLASTNNSGRTWVSCNSPLLQGKTIRKIRFQSPGVGWITGGEIGQGFVYRTDDGGTTWVDRSPTDLQTPYHVVEDVIFTDSNTVVICGYKGYLARSTDNGVHWQRIEWKSIAPDSIIVAPLEEFHKVNDGVLFCRGKEDILKSSDGGVTWNDIFYIGTHYNVQLGGFFFHSVDSGFAIGGSGESALRFLTTDGGNSWKALSDTIGEVAGKVYFPGNGRTGYIVGWDQMLCRIAPMGENKVQLNSGFTWQSVPSVYFFDAKNGCIGGDKPLGLRVTSDGGLLWLPVDTTTDYAGVIKGNGNRFALPDGSVSTDGGETWHPAEDGLGGERIFYGTINNTAVFFTQINNSGSGVNLFVTTDWFSTSEKRQVPSKLGKFFFLNKDTGWMAQNELFMTTDGAHTWNSLGEISGVLGANCICFADVLNGWVGGVSTTGGKKTTVLHTVDGGKTWITQESMEYLSDTLYPAGTPVKGRLPTHICAKSSTEAWFVDGFYCVFHTNDGGKVWRQVFLPQICGDVYVNGQIAIAGDGSLYCTGENGMVLKISSNGENILMKNLPGVSQKLNKGYSLFLPIGISHYKQITKAYELNGASVKLNKAQKSTVSCRPLVVK